MMLRTGLQNELIGATYKGLPLPRQREGTKTTKC